MTHYQMGQTAIESKQDFIYTAYCHYIKHGTVLDIIDVDTDRVVMKADKLWHWLDDVLKLFNDDGTAKPLAPDISTYNAIAGVIENKAPRKEINKNYRPEHKHYKRKCDTKFVRQYAPFDFWCDPVERQTLMDKQANKFRTHRRKAQ